MYVSGRAKSQSVGRVKRLALSFVISLVPFAAQADIADVFRQFDRGTSADKDFVKTLILGIEDGFEAANDELKANGKPMLYCAPEALKLTGDQLVVHHSDFDSLAEAG